jgi:type I restriction enzyme S subunit
MIKKYEKYKESGIEWLGEIPEHWKVLNFRYIIDVLTDFTSNGSFADLAKNVTYLESGYSRLVRLTDLRENLNNNGIFVSEETHKYLSKSTLYGDEVLLANVGAYSGLACKVPHLDCPATLGPNMFLLKFKKELNNDFAFLSLNSEYLSIQLKNKAISSAQPKLNKEDVRTCFFVLPPVSEQTQISNFLDHQTAIIDDLIAQKEKLITLLKEKRQAIINEAVTKGLNPNTKMKDSGIEWLGEVPDKWIVSKIKFIASIKGRIGYKGYTKDDIVKEGEGALTLGAKHIDKENNLNLSDPEYITWDKYYESPEIMVKMNDVIFTQRGSLGKICHICSDIGKATINPSMVILTPLKILPRFLYFWLTANRIQTEVELLQSNTAVPMISQLQLSNFPVIIPPLEEQIKIVEHIDKSLEELKYLFDIYSDTISKLKEYRQSLISEAVTVKIDVREWKPNK